MCLLLTLGFYLGKIILLHLIFLSLFFPHIFLSFLFSCVCVSMCACACISVSSNKNDLLFLMNLWAGWAQPGDLDYILACIQPGAQLRLEKCPWGLHPYIWALVKQLAGPLSTWSCIIQWSGFFLQ